MSANLDPSLPPIGRLLDDLTTLVSQAAGAIVAVDRSTVAQQIKPDLSPVTAADEAAQALILPGLSRLLPGIPIVSEEAAGASPLAPERTLFLVDPLDGTREFLAGSDEFTINVALVVGGVPVVGCIAAPALDMIWRGAAGHGAERLLLPAGAVAKVCHGKTAIATRRVPAEDFTVAISRSHFDPNTEAFLARFPRARRIACGSALKFCRLAEGSIDLYPRLAPTHEWDVAAGHAIVVAAGGAIAAPNGEALAYGRSEDHYRVAGFIAYGDPDAR
jgi:3'(2'), 5'-bisphosphate nucleotidase